MGVENHGHSVKIPDWRIYKVEDVPELMQVQKALAKYGLKDPWLRNEVWRYNPAFGTKWQRLRLTFFRGFKWGLAVCALTIVVEKALGIDYHHPLGHEGEGHGHH
ncbi:NADH dehydrogenase [ubiquinone] 1 beta subcomplex subunit 3 [Tachypleus tridentatus]|uniref:NADH dehydrogenase [ubiquinone] 1 beta subcomplex subunit 3 n=1 Tax=Tachypleus tridentatus TaxID=6853 RepID=UPI003FD3F941